MPVVPDTQILRRLMQVDYLSLGIQDQPGQHSEILFLNLKKKKKKARQHWLTLIILTT
jgi:hypothetical protein